MTFKDAGMASDYTSELWSNRKCGGYLSSFVFLLNYTKLASTGPCKSTEILTLVLK